MARKKSSKVGLNAVGSKGATTSGPHSAVVPKKETVSTKKRPRKRRCHKQAQTLPATEASHKITEGQESDKNHFPGQASTRVRLEDGHEMLSRSAYPEEKACLQFKRGRKECIFKLTDLVKAGLPLELRFIDESQIRRELEDLRGFDSCIEMITPAPQYADSYLTGREVDLGNPLSVLAYKMFLNREYPICFKIMEDPFLRSLFTEMASTALTAVPRTGKRKHQESDEDEDDED